MWTCIVCRFETELDDVVLTRDSGGCVCLRCFDRETGGSRPMPKALRRELTSALEFVDRAM
jgi:hypothetical protein